MMLLLKDLMTRVGDIKYSGPEELQELFDVGAVTYLMLSARDADIQARVCASIFLSNISANPGNHCSCWKKEYIVMSCDI
jgi:hypothetical protein